MSVIGDLMMRVVADMSGFEADVVKEATATGDKAGQSMGKSIGGALKRNAGKVVFGGLAVGAGIAFKGVRELEDAVASFRAETGATADEADRAGKAINAMAGRNMQSVAEIGATLAKVHTDLGLTGDEAERVTEQFLKFGRATGQNAADATASFDDILDAWNLTAADASGIMDQLVASHQKYGGSISANQEALASLAPALQAANMTVDDGVGLLNIFAASGVDAAAATTGMTKALTKVKSPAELKALIKDITDTQDPFERAQKAAALFGAKAGPKLAQALAGANIDDFTITVDEAAGATDKAAEALDSTFGARFSLLMKSAGSAITGFGAQFGPALTGLASLASLGGALGGDKLVGKLAGPLKVLGGKMAAKIAAGLAGSAAISVIGDALGGSLTKAAGSSVAQGAMSKIGGLLGNGLGAGLGLAAAGVAIVILAQELDKKVKENEAQLKSIGANVTKQVTDGSTEELNNSKAAIEAGLKKLDGVWDAGFHTGKARENLQRDLKAINEELASRAADAGENVRGAFSAAEPKVTDGAKQMMSGVPSAVKNTAENAGRLARQIPAETAAGIKSARALVSDAMSVLSDALKNEMSPAQERAKLLGQLAGKELARGLKSKDPIVKQAAVDARQAIITRLEALVPANGKIGKKAGAELGKALKSKDPVIRAAAQKLRATIEGRLNATRTKPAGAKAGRDVARGLNSQKGTVYNAARSLGIRLATGVINGVRYTSGKHEQGAGTAGGRAAGGPVRAGTPYWVNENTPRTELFVPATSGHILTHSDAMQAASSSLGGDSITVNVPVQGALPVRTIRDLATEMKRLGDAGLMRPRTIPPMYKRREAASR